MIRRPPRSTQSRSSAASDVYKRQPRRCCYSRLPGRTEPTVELQQRAAILRIVAFQPGYSALERNATHHIDERGKRRAFERLPLAREVIVFIDDRHEIEAEMMRGRLNAESH